jgi:hypothetical protein
MKLVCPKCGSDKLISEKKGSSPGKAAIAAILASGLGLVNGLYGSNKTIMKCLACLSTFPVAEGKKIPESQK